RENTLLFYCGDNGTSADSALGVPHRGVKSQVYEGGILVPGLIEWPARIPKPRTTSVCASTCDLLPTVCAITGQPLPERPLDGIDLTGALEGRLNERPSPLYFWMYDTQHLMRSKPQPWIDPKLQQGTTPLVKLMDGKATRDFTNYRQPPVTDDDYLGPRAIIDGHFKLVLHDQKNGTKQELFDLDADPAEKTDLLEQQPKIAERLQARLRDWQQSVLNSLAGNDYRQ
ncbi:MAG TPA: sulfatase-like hydrolase/transferase, partial [Planctomycetaceae bacterium]|nr:sulfatase-like hydrolase/transferase [Planctomycetaceae bacterium]